MEIKDTQSAFEALSDLRKAEVEEFWAVAMTSGKRIIDIKMLFRGGINFCSTHPREIFRFAIISNACSILVAHNHPHGDVTPSFQDIQVTRNLIKAGKIVGIPVIDHLIVTEQKYMSLAECGLFTSNKRTLRPRPFNNTDHS